MSGEASKSGVPEDEAVALARAVAALPNLRVRGIMGIPAPTQDEAAARAQFRALARCFDACREAGLAVDTLSMGMSADLELAIEEGSTEVRVGTCVRLRGEGGSEREVVILGPWDSRPENAIYSYQSEFAQRLLGARPGDRVNLAEGPVEVVAISPWA